MPSHTATGTLQAAYKFFIGTYGISRPEFHALQVLFFIDAERKSFLVVRQIQTNDIYRFCHKLRVSADAP